MAVAGLAALAWPAVSASGKPVSSANLKALGNSINRAKHLTYLATYAAVSGGRTTTVTIAQDPPKSSFSSSGSQVVNDGTHTYYCSASGGTGSSGSGANSGDSGNSADAAATGKTNCISVKGSNPLLGLEDAFSPTIALGAIAQARQGLFSRLLGTRVSSSSATFAGQPSTCITISVRGRSAKYCVTKQGVLAYSGTASNHFALTAYSSNPPAGLFTVPAGSTTPSLPGSSSLP